MKKNTGIVIAALVWFIIAITCVACPIKHLYTLQGEIYIVSYEDDMTVILDENGQIWGMRGTEVPARGTPVILTMDSMGTDTIFDDSIVDMKIAKTR